MTWKDKTCEGCKFRVADECRRFPIGISVVKKICLGGYPTMEYRNDGYIPACAEYTKEGQPSAQILEAARVVIDESWSKPIPVSCYGNTEAINGSK